MPKTSIAVDDYDPSLLALASTTHGRLSIRIGLGDDLEVPVVTVRGAEDGPTALLVAGIHGDEFEGIAALAGVTGAMGIWTSPY